MSKKSSRKAPRNRSNDEIWIVPSRDKRQDKVTARPAAPAAPAPPTPPKTVFDELMEYTRVSECPEACAKYLALFGIASPVDQLLGTHLQARSELQSKVQATLHEHLEALPCDVGVQTTRVGVTTGSKAVISFAEITKAIKGYQSAGVDVIATVDFRPMPYEEDAHGFAFAIEVDTLVFGADAKSKLELSLIKRRRTAGFLRSELQWCRSDDEAATGCALKSVMQPDFMAAPRADSWAEALVPPGWPSESERDLQGYVKAMALAQVPLRKLFLLSGAGKTILLTPRDAAEKALKLTCKKAEPALHRNEVVHFIFSEFRRLGLNDVSVPVVKLS